MKSNRVIHHSIKRALLCTGLFSVISGFIPPLHSLSITTMVLSIASGYLDHYILIFYTGTLVLILAGTTERRLNLVLMAALSLFAATGESVAGYSDLSADRIYTLRPYTRELISSLDSECLITWYCPDSFPDRSAGKPVAILLDRIAAQNRAHVRIGTFDPALHRNPAFAEQLGLQPQADTKYSAFMIEYRGNHRLVPAASDFTMVEYEIARSLEMLSTGKAPYLPLQMLILGNPEHRYEQLQTLLQYAGFTLVPPVRPEDGLEISIPLIVIGSEYAEPSIARSIDRFLGQGGSAAFFVSGTVVAASTDWNARTKENDPVLAMLKKRGVDIAGSFIRDREHYTIVMPPVDGSEAPSTIPYPPWPRVKPKRMPNRHPVFSGISTLQFFWPSPIYTAETGAQVLLTSSVTSQKELAPFHTHPFDPRHTVPVTQPDGPYTLGVSMESAGRMLVIPDQYAISALTDYTGSYDNLVFFVNCAEWISRREAITALKRTPPSLYATLGILRP